MCNDFGNHIPYSDYLAAFSQTRIPVGGRPQPRTSNRAKTSGRPTRLRSSADSKTARTNSPNSGGAFRLLALKVRRHQFPFRRTPVLSWPLPSAGLVFLRVHGHEIAEDEMAVHQGR